MTPRSRGDYFERQARAALAADGWVVIRSAGSYGPADLVALKDGATPMLISCKLSGRIGPGERADLVTTCRAAGAAPVMAQRTRPGEVGLSVVGIGAAHTVSVHLPAPRDGVMTNG
jgi:Holliday junction resolvase